MVSNKDVLSSNGSGITSGTSGGDAVAGAPLVKSVPARSSVGVRDAANTTGGKRVLVGVSEATNATAGTRVSLTGGDCGEIVLGAVVNVGMGVDEGSTMADGVSLITRIIRPVS